MRTLPCVNLVDVTCLFWHSSSGLLLPFVFTPCLWCSQHSVCPCTTLMKLYILNTTGEVHARPCAASSSSMQCYTYSPAKSTILSTAVPCHMWIFFMPRASSDTSFADFFSYFLSHLASLTLLSSPLSSMHPLPHAELSLAYAYSAKLYIPMHDLSQVKLILSNNKGKQVHSSHRGTLKSAQRSVKLNILNTTCEIHARPCAAKFSSV